MYSQTSVTIRPKEMGIRDRTHVGGYDDLVALHRAGKLEPLFAGQADGEQADGERA